MGLLQRHHRQWQPPHRRLQQSLGLILVRPGARLGSQQHGLGQRAEETSGRVERIPHRQPVDVDGVHCGRNSACSGGDSGMFRHLQSMGFLRDHDYCIGE